jgi:hypothetical protein
VRDSVKQHPFREGFAANEEISRIFENLHTIKKHTKALVHVSKVNGLEVNADKIRYMVMSRDSNAERSQNVLIGNSYYERTREFIYFWKKNSVKTHREALVVASKVIRLEENIDKSCTLEIITQDEFTMYRSIIVTLKV